MAYDHEQFARPTRRDFLKVVGGGAGAALAGGTAYAHHHPVPMPQSLQYLDRRTYIHNMELIAHFLPGQERSGGMGMMTVGERRLIFQQGDIIDVSDPRNPKTLAKIDMPEGWHSHKVRVANGLMRMNREVLSPELAPPVSEADSGSMTSPIRTVQNRALLTSETVVLRRLISAMRPPEELMFRFAGASDGVPFLW